MGNEEKEAQNKNVKKNRRRTQMGFYA